MSVPFLLPSGLLLALPQPHCPVPPPAGLQFPLGTELLAGSFFPDSSPSSVLAQLLPGCRRAGTSTDWKDHVPALVEESTLGSH